MKTHVFAVCAYGDSPYLESCVLSLLRQSVSSDIIICTSTPSDLIAGTARRHRIPLYVREGKSGLGADWNFAFEKADARFVTIAHQDDLYHRDYTKYLYKAIKRWPDMSLFSTDYVVIRGGRAMGAGLAGLIKRLLRLPLIIRPLAAVGVIKKAVLSLGNPIICPSCAYSKEMLKGPLFDESCGFVPDWDNLLRMADLPGRFICEEQPLLAYRMHGGSETERQIKSSNRFDEEKAVFDKIWPEPVSSVIMKFYRLAARAYH